MKTLYISLAVLATVCGGLIACSDDNPSGASIFSTKSVQRDAFETWLLKNYAYPYNVDFKYKLQDIETDIKYNLIPADSAKTAKLAIITKYLWFDAYTEVAGQDFVKANVPRIILPVGSPAYNSEGTMVLGTAEGGYKVVLYMVNNLTPEMFANYDRLNYFYFHTMHHEFTHILNQKKPYDKAYELITKSDYVSGDWYSISDKTAHQKGFVSPYAMSEPREDIAELLAFYVTYSPTQWQGILTDAGTKGATFINEKLKLLKTYMQESWNVDLDQLRDAVLRRGATLNKLDLEHLN